MQPENWKAIEDAHAISLDPSDKALLDEVQKSLGLKDGEFLHFLILIGKVAPAAVRLKQVRLPKP